MKKIILALAICLFGFCHNAGASVYTSLPAIDGIVMIPCLQGDGIDMLARISEKCENDNVSTNDFTQAEYAYMIKFINEMLDAADEYDARGESDRYIEESKDQMELLTGFATLLSVADSEGKLDSTNSAALAKLMERIEDI